MYSASTLSYSYSYDSMRKDDIHPEHFATDVQNDFNGLVDVVIESTNLEKFHLWISPLHML